MQELRCERDSSDPSEEQYAVNYLYGNEKSGSIKYLVFPE